MRVAPPRCESRRVNRHPGGYMEGLLWWLIVGLIAGVLASFVMGGGFGIVGDIIIGSVGAFVGGWLFSRLGVGTPFAGLAGSIFVAFIGAVVLLFVLRLVRCA